MVRNGRFKNWIVANLSSDESMRETFERISKNPVIAFPNGRMRRLFVFYATLRRIRPNVVIFHFFNIDQAIMGMIARLVGVPVSIAAAGTAAVDLSTGNRRKWKVSLIVNRIAKIPIVSASSWIERTLADLTRLPRGSRVIHNGIETDQCATARKRRERRSMKSSRWKLGMVARLEGAKDHARLIEGFKDFLRQTPDADAELRLIGDGPLRANLEHLVKVLGLTDRVLFIGMRHDVPDQLAELDAFVFSTTKKEGFGIALIEALAVGVPVIANDVPSSREILQNGRFGTLVSGETSDAWANALSKLWKSGPAVMPPKIEEIKTVYGTERFSKGYFEMIKSNTDID